MRILIENFDKTRLDSFIEEKFVEILNVKPLKFDWSNNLDSKISFHFKITEDKLTLDLMEA
jgi:hypothetical protein